ncbi:hypothetical protein HELRODRAFT_180628 [Helobdella robusta]|uniref:Transmembrane protein 132E n=1 Tax=Helobdella robusta TaxID=6412 RepID=T1FG37_HELRO|nr:hypothetical protein HELRODRAFT_180628 [Helobdella robusta]ESN93759.1 hypothetical protein HELRODRAFT_180628 [Helobdella robusta]
MVNMAVITGKTQNYTLKIFSVTPAGRVDDVTSYTTCHSSDQDVVKRNTQTPTQNVQRAYKVNEGMYNPIQLCLAPLVTETCARVYLDGSETSSHHSVSVITKFGKHTKFLYFRVWRPNIPITLTVSDSILNQVRGWRVPKKEFNSDDNNNNKGKSQTNRRAADFGILSDKESPFDENYSSNEDVEIDNTGSDLPFRHHNSQSIRQTNTPPEHGGGSGGSYHHSHSSSHQLMSCETRFQSAVVEVFATFSVPQDQYLVNNQVRFRITDLVIDRISIGNRGVASLTGNIVEGSAPGVTNVQVKSSTGSLIGSVQIEVTTDKVNIESIRSNVITGLSLQVSSHLDLRGAIVARLTKSSEFKKKYQEATLEMTLNYDDGTSLPLHHIPERDVLFTIDVLDDQLIAVKHAHPFYSPRFLVLKPGQGDLIKLTLESSPHCFRKKPRLLAIGHVYVDADLANDEEEEEFEVGGALNHVNQTLETVEKGVAHINLSYDGLVISAGTTPNREFNRKMNQADASNSPTGNQQSKFHQTNSNNNNNGYSQHPPSLHASALTPLEIGMYTLLAVFCLAVFIFIINCAFFMAKHRRKNDSNSPRKNLASNRKLSSGIPKRKDGTVAATTAAVGAAANCSPDWVWIGREILERNAIDTACQRALMPNEKFNNNNNNNNINIINNINNNINNVDGSDNNNNNNNNNSSYNMNDNNNTNDLNIYNNDGIRCFGEAGLIGQQPGDNNNCRNNTTTLQRNSNYNNAPLSTSSATTTATTNVASNDNSPPPLTSPSPFASKFNPNTNHYRDCYDDDDDDVNNGGQDDDDDDEDVDSSCEIVSRDELEPRLVDLARNCKRSKRRVVDGEESSANQKSLRTKVKCIKNPENRFQTPSSQPPFIFNNSINHITDINSHQIQQPQPATTSRTTPPLYNSSNSSHHQRYTPPSQQHHFPNNLVKPLSPRPSLPHKFLSNKPTTQLTNSTLNEKQRLNNIQSENMMKVGSSGKNGLERGLKKPEGDIGYCNSGSSDVEWDCVALGVPPDELSEYFDNLKESIA